MLARDKQSALAQIEIVKSANPQLAQKLYRVFYRDKILTVHDER